MCEIDDARPFAPEAELRRLSKPSVFQRGVSYLGSGAVERVVCRGGRVQARVDGSRPDPYRVRLELGEDGLREATCSCPYDRGGLCKHVVALGLCLLREPERVEDEGRLRRRLAEVPSEELADLVEGLLDREPSLTDAVETWLAARGAASATPDGEPTSRGDGVDPARYRERVRRLVHSLDDLRPSEAYERVPDVVEDVIDVGREAGALLEAGRPRAASTVLEAVVSTYRQHWLALDSSGGSPPAVFHELGPLWTRALLETRLDGDEPEEGLAGLAARLETWIDDLLDYGVAGALDGALLAAREGWEAARDPPETASPPIEGPPGGDADPPPLDALKQRARADAKLRAREEVLDAALDVLERRGRHGEAIDLARERDRPDRVARLLASTGDLAAAVEHAREGLGDPASALEVARALHREGATDRALEIGAGGLGTDGPPEARAELASWLERRARGQGAQDLALEAAIAGFQVEPTVRRFEAIQRLAGEDWPGVREELLNHLERAEGVDPFARVEVLLHAGRVEAAVEAVGGEDHHALVEPVAEAAVEVAPEWVVEASLAQAEPIVENGRSKRYEHAVDWLDRARRAWEQLGERETWRAYLDELREEHGRKRKLMGLVEARFG